jgi:hypothetical protein
MRTKIATKFLVLRVRERLIGAKRRRETSTVAAVFDSVLLDNL